MFSHGNFIDAHCHLANPLIQTRLDSWIKAGEAEKISAWIQGGINEEDWYRQLELAQKYPGKIHCSFGLHPWMAAKMTLPEIEHSLNILQTKMPQACALGELGLDFGPKYIEGTHSQMAAFEAQLKLSANFQKPMVMHIVEAHQKSLELLRKYSPYPRGGIIHSFNGPIEMAREYLSLGFKLSIGPQVMREGYLKLKKAIPLLSLDEIVVETDAPDRDLSGLLLLYEVAKSVATLKGIETEKILRSSTENLKAIFGI